MIGCKTALSRRQILRISDLNKDLIPKHYYCTIIEFPFLWDGLVISQILNKSIMMSIIRSMLFAISAILFSNAWSWCPANFTILLPKKQKSMKWNKLKSPPVHLFCRYQGQDRNLTCFFMVLQNIEAKTTIIERSQYQGISKGHLLYSEYWRLA